MIHYILAICIWALLFLSATRAGKDAQTIVGLAMLVGAVYALAQLLKV